MPGDESLIVVDSKRWETSGVYPLLCIRLAKALSPTTTSLKTKKIIHAAKPAFNGRRVRTIIRSFLVLASL